VPEPESAKRKRSPGPGPEKRSAGPPEHRTNRKACPGPSTWAVAVNWGVVNSTAAPPEINRYRYSDRPPPNKRSCSSSN
jgi:hypothetical protein